MEYRDNGIIDQSLSISKHLNDLANDHVNAIPSCPRGQSWVSKNAKCEPFITEELINEEVTFQNGKQKFPGTITKPKTNAIEKFPAVIFIHGSGPNDRDESSEGALGFTFGKEVKPFKDIAEYLAKHGYLTLRYDKRTCTTYNSKHCTSTTIENLNTITVDLMVDDASKGLDYLKTRNDVRSNDLIIIGHSKGGIMVLDLGRKRTDIKSVIILAGSATSLREYMTSQFEQIITWLKASAPSVDRDKKIADIQDKRDKYDKGLTAIEEGTYSDSMFENAPVCYWKSWIDMQNAAKKNIQTLTKPIAVVSGTEDYNLPPKHTQLLQTWRGAHLGDFFQIYDSLTHPLVKYDKKSNTVEDHVDDQLLSDIQQWLNSQSPN